ncbi:exodeoxyribonuclease VII large subunit, partial [Candidatus Azambacteria bacterium]|nr:exodeoxyribonuclease VII large subunit [Candidatus Azambacteria bacterium]
MTNLKIFSVAEYVAYLNEALSERDAVVEGEISEYKINQSKWIFFKVKDEEATLECFSTVFKLRLPLEDGMRVRVYGRPGIYAKSGKFSMTVEWAEPAGEGALKRSFELLKAELEKEGLFAAARKRPLPRFPKKIALVASKESAAYGDFTKILKQRFGGLEVFLYHVQVQGGEAIADIQKAFSYFNAHHKELGIEAVALVRGGGSLEDLAAFNSREVAYAVFGSAVPVIAGIGHEQDETIADFVADVRASTPSQAAELLVPHRDDVRRYVDTMADTMGAEISSRVDRALSGVGEMVGALDMVMAQKANALLATAGKLALHLKFFSE